MMALERLSPLERAAFLLHDVFGPPLAEVAVTLGRDAAAVRQLAARARKHVQDARLGDGTLQTTALEIEESHIVSIFITRNPDKLIVATDPAASRHSIH